MRNHTSSKSYESNPAGNRITMLDGHHADQFDSLLTMANKCGPVIYAVLLDDGLIKIGFTTNINQRMNNIGCGLGGLLALIPGTLRQEKRIHNRLIEHRAHDHEYYYPNAQIIAFVNAMRAKLNLKPIAA